MSEKEEVVFDADVLRRIEFLERWHNKIVESTELAKCASGAFAFLSFLALLGCGIFWIVAVSHEPPRTPSSCPANVGELVETLETLDPETPLGKEKTK